MKNELRISTYQQKVINNVNNYVEKKFEMTKKTASKSNLRTYVESMWIRCEQLLIYWVKKRNIRQKGA